MDQVLVAPAHSDDRTAKTRISTSALALFAEHGVDATSMRTIAAAAGVTVGLIVHHYGTKQALCEAVEVRIVAQVAAAIASVPLGSLPARELPGARDLAVADLLARNPAIVDYLRRAILDGNGEQGDIVTRLSQLAAENIRELRDAGVVATSLTIGEQVTTLLVRQLGRLFLQPLIDRIGEEFADEFDGGPMPRLVVNLKR